MNHSEPTAAQPRIGKRSRHTCGQALFQQLYRIFGPLTFGVLLDIADLLTFHHFGLYAGFIVGFAMAWWITGMEGLSTRARLLGSILAGIYCMTPFTETLPLATIVMLISAVARFCKRCTTVHWLLDQ